MNDAAHILRSSILWAILLTLGMAPHAGVEQGEAVACGIHPSYLRCEYRVDPLGIDVVHPRLFVATSVDKLSPADADLWDSGSPLQDRLR